MHFNFFGNQTKDFAIASVMLCLSEMYYIYIFYSLTIFFFQSSPKLGQIIVRPSLIKEWLNGFLIFIPFSIKAPYKFDSKTTAMGGYIFSMLLYIEM